MSTLTLEHLAPYLHSGINAIDSCGERLIITGIEDKYGNVAVYFESKGWHNRRWLNDIKPLLRPLSDLTKEIEHNGEKFVPILELARIAKCRVIYKHDVVHTFDESLKNNIYTLQYYLPNQYGEITYMFSYWQELRRFTFREIHPEPRNLGIPFQLDLFQALFRWHFNVFNLPEDLWIDLNTVQK